MNGISSNSRNINNGVPQGSVLGPLLFLIYVNDLQFASKKFHKIIYADDTNLFLSAENIDELCVTCNEKLKQISNWFLCNKLKLNVDKTSCMLFKPRNKYIDCTNEEFFSKRP